MTTLPEGGGGGGWGGEPLYKNDRVARHKFQKEPLSSLEFYSPQEVPVFQQNIYCHIFSAHCPTLITYDENPYNSDLLYLQDYSATFLVAFLRSGKPLHVTHIPVSKAMLLYSI